MVVKEVFCCVLLAMVVSTAAVPECNGGVQCVLLEKCKGLHDRILQGLNLQLRKLLQSLHCGYEVNKPMICCPPEFESLQPQVEAGLRHNFPEDPEDNEPVSLLPDGQVCGIQSHDKMFVEHPWTALLQYEKTIGSGFYCGGVLISSKYVLTTASCVLGQDLPYTWTLSQVRLGEWDTASPIDCYLNECNDPYLDVPIDETIVHENYNASDPDQYDDIALIRLAQDVQFTDFIRPICLPAGDLADSIFKDQVLEVSGWGEIESHSSSHVKLLSEVPVIAAPECSKIYRDIIGKQLCGGAKESDTCRGDYGGALMGNALNVSNWLAFGLASYRPMSCQSPEYPTVYTRVDAYIDWIVQNLKP